MKKIIASIFAFVTLSANAQEIVTVNYSFSQADSMANYTRTLVNEANQIQKKYTFVFESYSKFCFSNKTCVQVFGTKQSKISKFDSNVFVKFRPTNILHLLGNSSCICFNLKKSNRSA